MIKPTVALLCSMKLQRIIINDVTRKKLSRAFNIVSPTAEGDVTPEIAAALLKEADGCMTGWGSPSLTAELLAQSPRLKIVAHSAGSIKPVVSDAIYERGIVITTCAPIIATDVADFTLGAIIFGMKNVMEVAPRLTQDKDWEKATASLYRKPDDPRGCTVGVISAGQVGRCLLKLLPHFDIQALLYDPFVTTEQAKAMHAEKVELDALFERSDVVTCHAPSIPATKHIVNAERLAKLRNGAVFINTARGTCVDENALVAELQKKRIWAFLDVFDPEPPPPESPLYCCPNLTMTPHISGSTVRGRLRLGEQAFKELQSFFKKNTVQYGVSKNMLDTMA
ncbi:MAG: hydroxyacid dehydrogenase [Planctomycetota bacterium]